jgi:hypothetical protein
MGQRQSNSRATSPPGDARHRRRLDAHEPLVVRPLLCFAYQTNARHLQILCDRRQPLLRIIPCCSLGAKVAAHRRVSVLARGRLCAVLALKLVEFNGKIDSTKCLKPASCILVRTHQLPGCLGKVASAGRGHLRSFGSSWLGQLLIPQGGVAFDGDGGVAISDWGSNRVQIFRYSDGESIRAIGVMGGGNGQFRGPWGLAFDDRGHIVVCDSLNHRVQVLRYTDGAHIRTIGARGKGPGQFEKPSGLAIDAGGNVAVYDGNSRVQVFNISNGRHIRTIGSRGSGYVVPFPHCIFVTLCLDTASFLEWSVAWRLTVKGTLPLRTTAITACT